MLTATHTTTANETTVTLTGTLKPGDRYPGICCTSAAWIITNAADDVITGCCEGCGHIIVDFAEAVEEEIVTA